MGIKTKNPEAVVYTHGGVSRKRRLICLLNSDKEFELSKKKSFFNLYIKGVK
jgi:hypothetical protein